MQEEVKEVQADKGNQEVPVKKFIYVDKRAWVSGVDWNRYYTVYKLERELSEVELSWLLEKRAINAIKGMHLPKSVPIGDYEAYEEKHKKRGDVIQEFGKN